MRIGVVNYLNSKPLVYGLEQDSSDFQLLYDLPSRLAESLAAGRLDVALIPSVEFFRLPHATIVSDACVACRGPVLSVKLYFRRPPEEVRLVALDEGSRTSAALTQILLKVLCGIAPGWEPLPIGCGIESTQADAVLLIGDRAIESAEGTFHEVWDLGERWFRWAGLPFVFAMWIARPGVETSDVATLLTKARDKGIAHLSEIAEQQATCLNISTQRAARYLQENLYFRLGKEEQKGLARFYDLCVERQLIDGPKSNIESLVLK